MLSKVPDIVMVAMVILVISYMLYLSLSFQSVVKKEVLVGEFQAGWDSLYRSPSENRWPFRAKQMVGGWHSHVISKVLLDFFFFIDLCLKLEF